MSSNFISFTERSLNFEFSKGISLYQDYVFTNPNTWAFNLFAFGVASLLAFFYPEHVAYAIIIAVVPLVPKMFYLIGNPDELFFRDMNEGTIDSIVEDYLAIMAKFGISENSARLDLMPFIDAWEEDDARLCFTHFMYLLNKRFIVEKLLEEKTTLNDLTFEETEE